MRRLFPERPPPAATHAARLRYVRHWAIVGGLLAIPFWVLVFVWVRGSGVVLLFAAVAALSVLNVASLTWRIRRAERE